jgi:hypothetical protein
MELRISGPNVTAEAVALKLLELGVEASVLPTKNVCRDGALRLEEGAQIYLDCGREAFVATIWPELKRAFDLRCGWMDASVRGYRGCTENYCRSSACPYASS